MIYHSFVVEWLPRGAGQEKGFGFIVCDVLATQGFQGDATLLALVQT